MYMLLVLLSSLLFGYGFQLADPQINKDSYFRGRTTVFTAKVGEMTNTVDCADEGM